ncbi:MAG: amino acid adenylation domain-containing protein, partial [bacterium]|nr:amino acid adenylation domain-containing protein [bacterium]
GAYLPIGLEYPAEKRKFMLKDSGSKIVLVNVREDLLGYPAKIININDETIYKENTAGEFPQKVRSPSDLAHIMYTSGTTGTPKAVMIEDRAVINLITGMTHFIDFSVNDTVLSLITSSFDIFAMETLIPLSRRSKIVIGNTYQQSDPLAAGLVLAREKVTIFQGTPSMMRLFVTGKDKSKSLKGLKYLMLGGEALTMELLEKLKEAVTGRIFNLYGPTETTIYSAAKEVGPNHTLNIGKPIANTRIYILGIEDSVQPVGVAGELCIGGDGVARGYLGRPELTAERFTTDPFLEGERIYRTGDLARWLPDGNIEFLGRNDHQVKVKGLRIELGEIQSNLASHKDIEDVMLVVKED